MNTVHSARCRVSPGSNIRKQRHVAWASLVVLGLLFFWVSTSPASASQDQGQPRLAFWIATSNNGIFDHQTIRFIANHADIAVLNAPLSGNDGSLDYAQVVTHLHAVNSELPVLAYFWATRVYKGGRSGSVVTQQLPDMPKLLLKNPINGRPMRTALLSYGDVALPAYQRWLISRVMNVAKTTGVDGVVSDMAIRQPFPQWCKKKPEFCQRYATGVDTLFASLKKAMEPKLVMFNGLWANKPGRLARQEKLLNDTDGTAIEWFGRRQNKPIPPFRTGLLPYLQAIQNHPDKSFMVFARGATAYTSYREDYLWQRYLYAAYLMVARPNTSFRYLATFQSQSPGRAYMFTLYDDVATSIGVPQGGYRLKDGLYSRTFSNGLALFVPQGGEPATYTLPGTLYGPAGKSYSGKVHVNRGEGLVLYNKRLQPQPFKLSFAGAGSQKLALPASHVVNPANGTPFLALQALPDASDWQHDILLSPVKTLQPSLNLKIRLRTKDAAATLSVMAEVDDNARKAVQAVSVLSAGACPGKPKPNLRIAFRAPHPHLQYPQGCLAHFLKADGKWHTYTIPGTGVLPPRLKARRWEYLRFNGAVDLQFVSQPGPV